MTQDEAKLRERLKALGEAYKAVFTGPQGEMVLEDLLTVSGILGWESDLDTGKALFREGQRFMGLHVLRRVSTDPSAMIRRLRDMYEK